VVVTGSPLPLVTYFREFPSGRDDATRRLGAYLLATALTPAPLHHRLLPPRSLGRKLVRRRQDAPQLIALLDAATSVEALEAAAGLAPGVAAVSAALQAIEAVDDVELRLWALLAAKQLLPPSLRDLGRPLTARYEALAFQVAGRPGVDPLPRHPAAKGEAGGLDFAAALVRRVLLAPRSSSSDPIVKTVERDTAAMRCWIEYRLPRAAELYGLELKSLQFHARMLSALEGKSMLEAERVYVPTSDEPSDAERVSAAFARLGITKQGHRGLGGSLGSVYRGTLADGRAVAVKIKRQDIEQRVRGMGNRHGALLAVLEKVLRDDALSRISAGFLKAVEGQCNLRAEARHQQLLAQVMANRDGARVPLLHADLCSDDVLVQDYVDGDEFFGFLELATQSERNRVGVTLAQFMFTTLAAGFYYYDPHPGNFRLNAEGLWALDFGAVLPKAPGLGVFLEKIAAVEARDVDAFRRISIDEGNYASEDHAAWERFLQRHRDLYFAPFLAPGPFTFTPEFLREVLIGWCYRERAENGLVPSDLKVVNLRFFTSFYGMLATLGATANWRALVEDALRNR
jgi:hypothetical protein